jgi:hypothetical protein
MDREAYRDALYEGVRYVRYLRSCYPTVTEAQLITRYASDCRRSRADVVEIIRAVLQIVQEVK